MTRQMELPVGEHASVGPTQDMYEHGPVTGVWWSDDDKPSLWLCMDCGYVTDDYREFAHQDCDREKNSANSTWREKIEEDGYVD